jgi:hypothetical protein
MAHYAVVNPNRQAPEAHTPPPPVCVETLGRRSLETRNMLLLDLWAMATEYYLLMNGV